MVFCGKPSKGCQACRDRKTRCDRDLPSCSQCLRAQRICPGYRSQLDLMFRNESESVIVKAKAKKAREREKANKEKSKSPDFATSSTLVARPKSPIPEVFGTEEVLDPTIVEQEDINVPRSHASNKVASLFPLLSNQTSLFSLIPDQSLLPTIEEKAISYFRANSAAWIRSDVANDLCTQTTVDDVLVASMSAMGMASFAQAVHAPELMIRARRDYVRALQLTNAALRSPTEVKKDTTLFSVMILSIFETVTGSNERSLEAWTEHINGAAALIKLRGPEQFQTEAGQRMYLLITSNLMLSCVQRTTPMPQHIIALRSHAEKVTDTSSPIWKLSSIVIDFTIFRAHVFSSSAPSPQEIFTEALKIENRFIEMFLPSNLSPNWLYETIEDHKTDPDLVWEGRYHVYAQPWMAHIWNGMRTCRILLHEIIRAQLPFFSLAVRVHEFKSLDTSINTTNSTPPFLTPTQIAQQDAKSITTMLQLRTDILAAASMAIPSNSRNPPLDLGTRLVDGSRGYFVLWPLYLAASMDLTTEDIRRWCIGRLRGIGRVLGIRQADMLAEFLEKRKEVVVWEVREPGPPRVRVFVSGSSHSHAPVAKDSDVVFRDAETESVEDWREDLVGAH